MTSRLLMPCRRAGGRTEEADPRESVRAGGSVQPTAILDWEHPVVAALVTRVRREAEARGATSPRALLQVAHGIIARDVRPVYSVEERRRTSRTLRLGRGSCSQRMAVLESVARAVGVPTRVRGLLVDGAFWYPRFPRFKPLVPEHVLLAWPEFLLEQRWVPIAELFGSLSELSDFGGGAFTNQGGETLFDAVARTAVDWDGAPGCGMSGAGCDLSAQVLVDFGHFGSRDELFARHEQTLCWPARRLGEPVLGRWSAGARADAGAA
ncbi:transglutaminase domain-containing protein [Streptomyces sp. PSKA54]|uniref:Transglutaminase domain-containing protein n=1 Tax=Streptomyces himalayensis subsp. aureolus TaxID=2758039 RepID=A0A7W2D4A6_9ACTN|nr:transglutaminase domain-containing protein [Streptomyces himalayensis subsp. aureolus]